jgi:ParB family chromosome partitioning protein
MSAGRTKDIALRSIAVPPNRMRRLRSEKVDELAESIRACGLLLQPVVVRRWRGRYMLVVGAHRYEAHKQLGKAHIRAIVVDGLDADAALLAEIDENLIRAELSAAERALHLAERKRLYEKLHPETKHGSTGKGRAKSRQNGDSIRFTKDAAKTTGRSERTVQREVERGEKIAGLANVSARQTARGITTPAHCPRQGWRGHRCQGRGDEGAPLPTRTGTRGSNQNRIENARRESLRRHLRRPAVAL